MNKNTEKIGVKARKSLRIKECMKIHERIKKILIQRFIVVRYNTQ